MSLEIIWGPMYVQDKNTKKWSIRAGIKSEERVKEYRKRGLTSKKEAKIFWLNYLAENQDESIGITDKRVTNGNQRTKAARRTVTHL